MNKVILTWLTNSYVYYKAGPAAAAAAGIAKPQGIGYGIGLGFALFAMQGQYSYAYLKFLAAHELVVIQRWLVLCV